MQYILTEAEYRALTAKKKLAATADKNKLQLLCTAAANYVPITYKRSDGTDSDPHPWGCILNTERRMNPGYCDECAFTEICPNDGKEWSK